MTSTPASDVESTISIRPATLADVEALSLLFHRYQHEIQRYTALAVIPPVAHWRRQIEASLQQQDGTYLVAARERELLGFVALRIITRGAEPPLRRRDRVLAHLRRMIGRGYDAEPPPIQRLVFLGDLYVVPEARRRGLALPLIRQSFAWTRARGITLMEAAIWADNRVTLRLAKYLDVETVRFLIRKQL
jgi:GNAT superfamily N-acetyltransferase